MALYVRERRRCEGCEYFDNSATYSTYCRYNPPMISGDHQSGKFPQVDKDSYCSKWEPKWDDNPVIAEAWELFQATVKLAT